MVSGSIPWICRERINILTAIETIQYDWWSGTWIPDELLIHLLCTIRSSDDSTGTSTKDYRRWIAKLHHHENTNCNANRFKLVIT